MPDVRLKVFRGGPDEPGHFDEFDVPVEEGMVVLDALHWIQGHEAPDLAVRWNCKAAKCGSCSAEVDGRPRLTCKTRLSDFDLEETITVEPMRAFPLIRDLVTDVSWNYEVNKTDPAVHAAGRRPAGGLALAAAGHRAGPGIPQVHRVLPVPGRLPRAAQPRDREAVHGTALPRPGGGPRAPPDRRRRTGAGTSRTAAGSATATSRSAAPRSARSTSRSPTTRSSRSRSASPTRYYDPLAWAWRKLRGGGDKPGSRVELPVLQGRPRDRADDAARRRRRPPVARPDAGDTA